MKVLRERFNKVAGKYPAMVSAVLKIALADGDYVQIGTGLYFKIAQQNGLSFIEAKSVISDQSTVVVGAKMVAGLTGTVAKAAVRVITGQPAKATPEQRQTRIDICGGCEFYIKEQQRCSECGCPLRSHMPDKWDFIDAKCPKDKWPKIS